MTRKARSFEDIPRMADEVAELMAARFGGAPRGERPPLHLMLERRGAALPLRLRAGASRLAEARRLSAQPKVARQLPLRRLRRDHAALVAHLRPLGALSRWQGRAIGIGAALALGLLVLAGVALWVALKRGLI